MEIKIICRRGFGSQTTQIVGISRCCFAWDGQEMDKVLKRTRWAIVLPIRSFVFSCPRCRRRRGLLNNVSNELRQYSLSEKSARDLRPMRAFLLTLRR